ncbi:response regulator transcription factor [Roseospira marina]|uniref:response regulator transcription factor n=1 Tax=Roseospira marina TaxID=140057 RepID=UPI0014793714|nr:response regulator transcription factor [Roseospira marina]MBB4312977.1 DNA-binding response OmpR family regulator [Roseospira marina]MBB5086250.1 DNA-binding response OmpR family regulator [Roseospira marina]
MSSICIALVDDEPDFREPTARYLRKRGMTVHEAGSIEDLTATLTEIRPDILLLDVGLPGETGLEAIQRLRDQTGAGVIMVTARGGLDDRIDGLDRGADSYLTKPVDMRELEAVVLSVWRRIGRDPATSAEGEAEAAWLFDAEAWTLISPDGETVRLSGAEYGVLWRLTETPGQPVSRDRLFEALHKPQSGPEDRSLDVLVSRLRRKFSVSAFKLPVRSVRGVGYVFPTPVSRRGPD